ncbi:MAG: hypothetical protein ACOC44_10880 [Promethearchaeia archaeon]
MNLKDILKIKEGNLKRKEKLIQKIQASQSIPNLFISTNSQNFDAVLGGGFLLGAKYLIFGPNRTGKTQFAHHICVQLYNALQKSSFKAQINKRYNIPEGSIFDKERIYFLDCENTFRPERIESMAKAQNLPYMDILKMIQISKIYNLSALLTKIKEIQKILSNQKPLLLIIDSLNKYFRAGIADGLSSFNKIQKLMKEILKVIHQIQESDLISILATAQVSAVFTEESVIKELPAGNRFLNQIFSEYVYLQIDDQDKRYAHLVNSSRFPEKRLRFQITQKGIEDYSI